MRVSCHAAGRLATDCPGGPRRSDLPPPNLKGLLDRARRRSHRAQLPPRPQATFLVGKREADPARNWHRRSDTVRSQLEENPPADQPSQAGSGVGGVWDRNRGAGSCGTGRAKAWKSVSQNGLRTTTSASRIKNCAEHCSEPQITGTKPLICLRVMRPSVPQEGQASTAQYGSSFSPISPAFSSTKTVPGAICSGIHSLLSPGPQTMSPSPVSVTQTSLPMKPF